MLQNPNVTDAEWRELNNSIISAFANEQRPLKDLLTQIKAMYQMQMISWKENSFHGH